MAGGNELLKRDPYRRGLVWFIVDAAERPGDALSRDPGPQRAQTLHLIENGALIDWKRHGLTGRFEVSGVVFEPS